jgi:hypothetical protein
MTAPQPEPVDELTRGWTNGPWFAHQNGTVWQIDAAHDAVATTQFCYAAEKEANAHLIASAPDLYDALLATRGVLRAVLAHPGKWKEDAVAKAVFEIGDKAIARAHGRTGWTDWNPALSEMEAEGK